MPRHSTARLSVAAASGAEVHQESALLSDFGLVLGKGDAMWRAIVGHARRAGGLPGLGHVPTSRPTSPPGFWARSSAEPDVRFVKGHLQAPVQHASDGSEQDGRWRPGDRSSPPGRSCPPSSRSSPDSPSRSPARWPPGASSSSACPSPPATRSRRRCCSTHMMLLWGARTAMGTGGPRCTAQPPPAAVRPSAPMAREVFGEAVLASGLLPPIRAVLLDCRGHPSGAPGRAAGVCNPAALARSEHQVHLHRSRRDAPRPGRVTLPHRGG